MRCARVLWSLRTGLASTASLHARVSVKPRYCLAALHRRQLPRFRSESSTSHPVDQNSTIYALSTAPGRAAIAIIRLSGPGCVQIYRQLCPGTQFPKPRYAAVRSLHEPLLASSGKAAVLDSNALILSFPGPRSVTGEDVLELHVHGGPAIVKAVLSAIGKCDTKRRRVRYAEPGEFTRRAFLNDRLDLPQIEALGDTLSAVTEEQRRLSVQGTTSGLTARYESWRDLLLYARGELEALIDFSEDQHFDESPSVLAANVAVQIRALLQKITFHRANAVRGELLRKGISISLIGSPNVGKSSLLNLIVGRNAAIVSHEAGTTRDIVEVGLDLGGFFCRLGDTAGLRQSEQADPRQALANVVGAIEKEGIRRAKERALQSDVVLLVLSIEPSIDGQGAGLLLDEEVLVTARDLLSSGKTVLAVINKMDNYRTNAHFFYDDAVKAVESAFPSTHREQIFCISCRDAQADDDLKSDQVDPGHLQAFLSGLQAQFKRMTSAVAPDSMTDEGDPSQWEESLGATQRQGTLLEEAQYHLTEFLNMVSPRHGVSGTIEKSAPPSTPDEEAHEVDIVMAAESLRDAGECLGKITGRGEAGDVEEVLGVVFEKYMPLSRRKYGTRTNIL